MCRKIIFILIYICRTLLPASHELLKSLVWSPLTFCYVHGDSSLLNEPISSGTDDRMIDSLEGAAFNLLLALARRAQRTNLFNGKWREIAMPVQYSVYLVRILAPITHIRTLSSLQLVV